MFALIGVGFAVFESSDRIGFEMSLIDREVKQGLQNGLMSLMGGVSQMRELVEIRF